MGMSPEKYSNQYLPAIIFSINFSLVIIKSVVNEEET